MHCICHPDSTNYDALFLELLQQIVKVRLVKLSVEAVCVGEHEGKIGRLVHPGVVAARDVLVHGELESRGIEARGGGALGVFAEVRGGDGVSDDVKGGGRTRHGGTGERIGAGEMGRLIARRCSGGQVYILLDSFSTSGSRRASSERRCRGPCHAEHDHDSCEV